MKKLATVKNQTKKSSLIEKETLSKIIGGRRYETYSAISYLGKCLTLTVKGATYQTGYHNGKYCIEW